MWIRPRGLKHILCKFGCILIKEKKRKEKCVCVKFPLDLQAHQVDRTVSSWQSLEHLTIHGMIDWLLNRIVGIEHQVPRFWFSGTLN